MKNSHDDKEQSSTESRSLGELFPEQQARCRELLAAYKNIGPAGFFGAAMIEQTLRQADQAAMSGDVVAMLRLYEQMKEYQ